MKLNDDEKEKLECLPFMLQKRLMAKNPTRIEAKKLSCVLKYSSKVKLKSVVRWKERMVKVGVTTEKLGELTNNPSPRISEYLNFTHEPSEETFNTIEDAIYKLGA